MKQSMDHAATIRKELMNAGMSSYGLMKGEAKHLPLIMHPGEHIGGVIYGRHGSESAMFVATNLRMLFLEHKPLFRVTDEISYDVLSGVSHNTQGRFAGVTVHTRLGDYTILFVNRKCASIFIDYIEKRRLEDTNSVANRQPSTSLIPRTVASVPKATTITQPVRVFLASHAVAVLSTIDREGNLSGAGVFYALSPDNTIYIVTKTNTQKARNILIHPQIALTVVDQDSMETLQLQGTAEVETDRKVQADIMRLIIKPKVHGADINWPPITKLAAGNYVVIRIMPTTVSFYDYKN